MIRCKENATRENILLSWIPRAFLEKEFQLFLGLVRKKGGKNNMKKVSSRKTLPGAFGSTFKDARQKVSEIVGGLSKVRLPIMDLLVDFMLHITA